MKKFPVMLASPQEKLSNITFPAIAQTKIDGMRANIVQTDKTEVYSRNGKLMEMFDRFRDSIPENHVLDGEFLVYEHDKPLERKTGNGILHKSVVGTISREEVDKIKMIVWDIIPIDKWNSGFHDEPYHIRLKKVQELNRPDLFNIIDTHHVENMDQVYKLYNEKIAQGQEGLVLKNRNSPWESKRSKHMVKMKEVLEMDLRIVDYVEGEGKFKGMLGKFICENADRTINVGVGTGYSDEQRKTFTKDFIGHVCAVRYNAIIESKSKSIRSLFLPVFVEMRPDKEVED